MRVAAHVRHVHIAPQKVRSVRGLLIGLPVAQARSQLMFVRGKAPRLLQGVLNSAIANARHNFELDESALVVADVIVGDGRRLKRVRPASRGTAHPYQRRMAHITVVVEDASGRDRKKPSSRKKSTIETLSVEELAHRDIAEQRVSKEHGETVDADSPAVARDAKLEAYEKIKAQQRGGDRKKTFRRKSVGA